VVARVTSPARERLHLEDLAVGQRFTSVTHTLDAEQIVAYARQFDPQPFHLDEVAAQATFFGGLAASGWHVASITMRLIVESVPIAGGIIGGGGEIRWPTPTRPGDVLRAETEITEITPSRSRPERGMAVLRIETLNQNGEQRQIVMPRVIVPRRAAS
jgi:acyl dehydratase